MQAEKKDSMQYRSLGRTGLKVSQLCLGTMNFGPKTPEKDSFGIMDQALEAGVNFFDTANVYGGKAGKGVTEEIIGRWFAQGDGRRAKVVLATKVYGRVSDWPNDSRLSARHIRQACEDSLVRLQTDYIDLYQMHHVDRDTPWEEIWQAMEVLVQQGKVLYVGSSNFAGWQIAQAQEAARARHFMGLVSEQSFYNLAERSIELEVAPACEAYGLGILPYSPLAEGMLAGTGEMDKALRRKDEDVQASIAEHEEQLQRYEALCAEWGESPAVVALAWLLHQPVVAAPIIGPRTAEQLENNLRAVDFELSTGMLEQVDEIWPGPGGAAPEAYAW